MRKYIACLIGLVMVLGFIGMSSAAIVTDPTGDTLGTGPTDITAARAEQLTRGDGNTVLKVTYTATPSLGGIVIFEADVDNSSGTGGNLSMTGIPVSPCPCKTTKGIDIALVMLNRDQAATSQSAMCTGCSTTAGSCARKRYFGEWYAVAAGAGATDATGFLRGYSDPTPNIGDTSRSYTFPWAVILNYGKQQYLPGSPDIYTYLDALDPTTTKWQLSVWTDPTYYAGDRDDFANGLTFFNISDVVPNGDGNLVVGVDVGDALTFCEGNFDGNKTVDGTDASKFKSDFGRSALKNPCPTAGFYY